MISKTTHVSASKAILIENASKLMFEGVVPVFHGDASTLQLAMPLSQ